MQRWMLFPLEVVVIVTIVLLTVGGIVVSIEDAIQLEQAINLNLTEILILNQGIVNLQRDVLITHTQVLRQLSNPDAPPEPISHFVFAEIQISNLVAETQSPSVQFIFREEHFSAIQPLRETATVVKTLIGDLEKAQTPKERRAILAQLDEKLTLMEAKAKQLIDLQATAQRESIVYTRDSLRISQTTSVATGFVLLLMGVTIAYGFRRGLIARLNQEMEAERLKSRLLTSVSHELRTPINAIQGYGQLLREGVYGELSDDQQTAIRRISLNATQLQGMINNLLDRAQLEQGKLTLRKAPFSPVEFLESAQSALNILAVSKGLTLSSEIAPDVPATLLGDVLRLQQILFNLTSNALKFTEKGGVHARIFLPDSGHWALEVSDTGIGIPPEVQPQVFAPFWQVDSSATREHRGSGLGLSIVKQLAELMGATITLTSQVGKGTTFTVIFPLETGT